MMTMSEAKSLALAAKDAGERPRIHPLGFLQLDVRKGKLQHEVGDMRLHIWPDDPIFPRRIEEYQIHDHTFDIRSTVLKGAMVNTQYSFMPQADGIQQIYLALYSSRSDAILHPTGVVGDVEKQLETHVAAGENYALPAFIFHKSFYCGLTVTLMEKRQVYYGSAPRVLMPSDAPTENFNRHTLSEQYLWNYLFTALG